jgi:hypothetical protein
MLAPVIVEKALMPGADHQLQAPSPAQNHLSSHATPTVINAESADTSGDTGTGEQSEIKQETAYVRGSNEEQWGEQLGEQSIKEGGNPGEDMLAIDRGSKSGETGAQSTHKRGSKSMKTGEDALSGDELANVPVSQWLKTLFPEVSGGWWDVYQKDNGFAVKFRWRDQGLQTLTFPWISSQQLQDLKQSSPDKTERIISERITDSLQRFLLDPDKRDIALFVARKLGIDPDDLQLPTTTN